jgi:hypothetical protein
MAVYVDAAIWPYGRMKMCHMVADSVDELNAMADKIGVNRKFIQIKRYPHFDICKSKREIAVNSGAIEVDRRGFLEVVSRIKS